jgi:hypothetical protein
MSQTILTFLLFCGSERSPRDYVNPRPDVVGEEHQQRRVAFLTMLVLLAMTPMPVRDSLHGSFIIIYPTSL